MEYKLKSNLDDKFFKIISLIFISIIVVLTLYPFIFVASASISDPIEVMKNNIVLFPKGFSLEAYIKVFTYENIRTGYVNSIFYTSVGTLINMLFTTLAAYPLSRPKLVGKKFIMMFFAFTMLFSGGLIPTFLVIQNLGLYNTRLAILLPTAISTFNLILLRTYFQSIPFALEEAAIIDGASPMTTLIRIILPLSKPALVTIALYYAVDRWNSYFNAMVYLNDTSLYPIQIFLRDIVINGEVAEMMDTLVMVSAQDVMMGQSLKYATIMVVTLPIIIIYPFIQKYFVKGIMLGSIKE